MQIFLSEHVADGIMGKDRVKGSTQTDRSNIALEMFQLWVERAAHREHLRGQIDQGHLETGLEVRGNVASA